MPRSFPLIGPAILTAIGGNARRYLFALVVVALAIALRTLLNPAMGQQSVALFLAAILISAWLGGVGPALLSVALLHIVHAYWFIDPRGLWRPDLAANVTTAAYYLMAFIVGALSQMRTSAQQRAREEHLEAVLQRENLDTTLSCMADGVLVTDVSGIVTIINSTAEAMTGWRSVEANGKPWWEVFVIHREDGRDSVERPVDQAIQERRPVHESTALILTSRVGQQLPIAYTRHRYKIRMDRFGGRS